MDSGFRRLVWFGSVWFRLLWYQSTLVSFGRSLVLGTLVKAQDLKRNGERERDFSVTEISYLINCEVKHMFG